MSECNEFIRIDNNPNYLEYKNNSLYKNINEINMLIKIEKEDINKRIYFLNYRYTDNNLVKHHDHNNIKKLNKLNSKLYINKKQYEYKK